MKNANKKKRNKLLSLIFLIIFMNSNIDKTPNTNKTKIKTGKKLNIDINIKNKISDVFILLVRFLLIKYPRNF